MFTFFFLLAFYQWLSVRSSSNTLKLRGFLSSKKEFKKLKLRILTVKQNSMYLASSTELQTLEKAPIYFRKQVS
jgi:hypothetical protein